MQHQRSLWKLLLISFFAFLVVACKPLASFSVSPDPVKAGVEATFDASASMAYFRPKNNAIVSYAWSFGDGASATGKTATHTYASAGTFEVKLTVVDTAGRLSVKSESLVVQAADVVVDPVTTTLKVITQIAGGGRVSGAQVTILNATGLSDATGVATIADAPISPDQLVKVSKSGFVTQSVRTTLSADSDSAELLVTLKAEHDPLLIDDIAVEQVILSNALGASVSLPANALVNAVTGADATGPATLRLTPWNITNDDLLAMPGNGEARNSAGEMGKLISAGAITVEFFGASGERLQLAAGKSALIQMGLPANASSILGNNLIEGAAIPMWHFDETNGFFAEDGVGQLISTEQGLALQATVEHFSSWNWGFYYGQGSGSVSVSCEISTGVKSACYAVAKVTLPGGGKFARAQWLAHGATEITNMPAAGSIEWSATTSAGLTGSATSSTSGTVAILLTPPTTSNFVQCSRTSNVATPCKVTLSGTTTTGTSKTVSYAVPASGSLIETTLDPASPLNWSAVSNLLQSSATQWSTFSGATTSANSGAVTIALNAEVSAATSFPIRLSCAPYAYLPYNQIAEFVGEYHLLSSCQISVKIRSASGALLTDYQISNGLNGPVTVYLPPNSTNSKVELNAKGKSNPPLVASFSGFQAYRNYLIGDLTPNQSIALELSDTSGTPF